MFKFKVEMFFIKGFEWALDKLPESFRYKLAEHLAMLAYNLIKKRREVTLNNLRRAFPEKSEEEIEKIAIESYKIMIKTFMMSLWMPDMCRDDNKVAFYNYELFEEVKAQNKGVIIASLHMGCFEGIQKLALNNNFYDVIRKQKNLLLDKYMNDNRKKTGINLIYKGSSATRELVKALKNKDVVCLFSDHMDSKGCEIEFFGRKTRGATGVASLSLKYDSPVILTYIILDEKNKTHIYFDKILELNKTDNIKKDIEVNTQLLMDEYEKLIRKYPAQWMWFHNRWK